MRIPASVLRSWSLLIADATAAEREHLGGGRCHDRHADATATERKHGGSRRGEGSGRAESSDEDESERHHGGASGEAFD